MGAKDLLVKIESLPPEKRAAIEDLVDSLTQSSTGPSKAPRVPPGLIDRINARRQALLEEHGPFDSLPLIREFRDTGGR